MAILFSKAKEKMDTENKLEYTDYKRNDCSTTVEVLPMN